MSCRKFEVALSCSSAHNNVDWNGARMKSALLRMQAARNGSSENFQDFNPAENDPKMQDFTFG